MKERVIDDRGARARSPRLASAHLVRSGVSEMD